MADQLTDDQLAKRLREVLESWPLYRQLEYRGASGTRAVPDYISLFCYACKREAFFETKVVHGDRFSQPEDNRNNFVEKVYACRNCGTGRFRYYISWRWDAAKGEGSFAKAGQYPPLEERVPTQLATALDAADLGLYRNALRLRNFSLGLGAVAYLRRVVENRMNDMLDVLHEAARKRGASTELLAQIASIKADRRFSAKVDYAEELMPEALRPAGRPNPVGVLHELASDGLHARSDDECVDIFDACRFVFEYVFAELRGHADRAREFLSSLEGLAQRREGAARSGGVQRPLSPSPRSR